MPRGLVRYQENGDLHYVTFSCYGRGPYLRTREARDLFEWALERMRVRYDFFVTACVVMPEHVHLLVSEPREAKLATALQAIKLPVAVGTEERPFWSHRYHDFNVWSEREVIDKRRYIHRNPVARGLVRMPEEWQWSSFRHGWTGGVGTVAIESTWTAARRGGLGMSLGGETTRVPEPTSQTRDVGTRCGGGMRCGPPAHTLKVIFPSTLPLEHSQTEAREL